MQSKIQFNLKTFTENNHKYLLVAILFDGSLQNARIAASLSCPELSK